MNFLDAHIIINDYIQVLSKESTAKRLFRRASELKNSKEEIYLAYKIFLAHLFAFETRTQEQYEYLDMSIRGLNLFIDDSLANAFESAKEEKSKKSFLGRLLSKKADTDQLTPKQMDILKQIGPKMVEPYKSEELSQYTNELIPAVEAYRAQVRAVSNCSTYTQQESLVEKMKAMGTLCEEVYKIANIPMDDDDPEYFYPFPILQYLCEFDNLDYLFKPYKEYIFSNDK